MIKLLLIIMMSGFIALPLSAMKVSVLAWDQKTAKRELSIGEGEQMTKIREMHPFARARPIEVKGREKLSLVSNDSFDEEGNPLFLPLNVDESIQNPLVLVIPERKAPIGLKVLVIEDAVDDFEWGSLRFINLTGENLVFQYGKKKKFLPTGWKPSSLAPKVGRTAVAFSLREDLKTRLYTGIWDTNIGQRKLVFIVPSKDKVRGKIDFKFIVQYRAALEAEGEAQEIDEGDSAES